MAEPLGILVPQPGGLGFIIGRSNVLSIRQGLIPIMDAGIRLGRLVVLILLVRIPLKDDVPGGHGSEGGGFVHEDRNIPIFCDPGG